jgi:uncharacterized protein YjiS (DUF1127 family)
MEPHQPERNGRLGRWVRVGLEKWKRRKLIATLNRLDDHTLKDIGVQRRHIEQFANRICGVDSRISAPAGTPGQRHGGQSRLLPTS